MSVTTKKFDPETAGNFEEMEMQFAVKAVEHLEVYWKLLQSVPASKLRLTRLDSEILDHFHKEFPDFDLETPINEDEMKSKEGKEKWRNFVNVYEKGDKKIEDYNFGTMLRKNPEKGYTEDNTMLVLRMQFYAIEIARNRAGINDAIYKRAQEGRSS